MLKRLISIVMLTVLVVALAGCVPTSLYEPGYVVRIDGRLWLRSMCPTDVIRRVVITTGESPPDGATIEPTAPFTTYLGAVLWDAQILKPALSPNIPIGEPTDPQYVVSVNKLAPDGIKPSMVVAWWYESQVELGPAMSLDPLPGEGQVSWHGGTESLSRFFKRDRSDFACYG